MVYVKQEIKAVNRFLMALAYDWSIPRQGLVKFCLLFFVETWGSVQYNYIYTAVADLINPFSVDRGLTFPIFQYPCYSVWLAYQSNCTPREETKLFSSPDLARCGPWVGYPSSRLQFTDYLCVLCFQIAFAKGRAPSILHLSLANGFRDLNFSGNVKCAIRRTSTWPSFINFSHHFVLAVYSCLSEYFLAFISKVRLCHKTLDFCMHDPLIVTFT